MLTQHEITRRQWLQRSSRATTSGIAAGFGASAAVTSLGLSRVGHAIEPIGRERSSFKFSLAAYSYRNLLKAQENALTLFDFVDDCAEFGLQGTELTSYYFAADVTDDDLRQLKRHCFRQGLDVSGTAVGNDFGHPMGPERDEEIRSVKEWIRRAEILGAPVIRIFAGQQHGRSERETHKLIVDGISECCEHAGRHGIHLALENHGGPTSTATGLLALVQDVKSDWFGVNLDTGNFHSDNVYGELEQVAPYAVNVQVKAMVSGPNGAHPQKADFRRIADILRRANYRGYVALEFEEKGDPRTECPRLLDELRSAFARV